MANSLLENDPDEEFDELRFAVEDGTNLLVLINKGEVTGAVNIDNTYEFASSHYNDFKNLRDDEDIVINQEWILNKLSENDNKENFTQCISFDSSFMSPKNGGGAWNANEEYTWSWWLARSEGGTWKLMTWGY